MNKRFLTFAIAILTLCISTRSNASTLNISATDYPTIQEAINANPGRNIHVPDGDYQIDRTLMITADHSGLYGPGRIIQTNPEDSIVRVQNASFVRIEGLTLTRPADNPETTQEGITIRNSRFVEIDRVRVLDNRGPAGSIRVMDSRDCAIRNCLVYNYMIITVEDRTKNPLAGYAFKTIDGTGIVIVNSPGIMLANNRVVEENILPTPELKAKYDLGRIVRRVEKMPEKVPETTWNSEYIAANWHQGSGIYVGGSEGQVVNNYIRHAAQGMDIHSDHMVISGNIVDNSFMGMKAIHGSRNVLIDGNQFMRVSLWGICIAPGTNSHLAREASGNTPAQEANVDGGTIVSNNIVSDFGYGTASWMWAGNGNCAPIVVACDRDYPALKDVVIQGNVIYDPGVDQILVAGVPEMVPPRYRYAIFINDAASKIKGLRISNNILHPGTDGVSNHPLNQ